MNHSSAPTKFSNKRLLLLLAIIPVLLSIPAIAMLFTNEVQWTPFDFLVAAFLLGITIIAIEFTIRVLANRRYRIIAVAGILVLFFLVWIELAVGLVD